MEQEKQKLCRDVGCNASHVWYETREDGTRLICLKAKANGAWHVKKYVLPENVRELKPA